MALATGNISDYADEIEEYQKEFFEGSRQWLDNLVEQFIADPSRRHLIIIGEPGIGKSTFIAHLADKYQCPRYFTRAKGELEAGIQRVSPKTFLKTVGLQLRQKYGASIFKNDLVLQGETRVGRARGEANVVALEVEEAHLSPFRQLVIRGSVQANDIGDKVRVAGVHINRLIDSMQPRELLDEAIIDPLSRLRTLHHDETVILLIDGLDVAAQQDGTRIVDVVPRLSNLRVIMTSRPGPHLANLPTEDKIALSETGDVSLDDLSKSYIVQNRQDVYDYIHHIIYKDKEVAPAVRDTLAPETPETYVSAVWTRSDGNFLYLRHFFKALRQDIQEGQHGLLNPESVPEGLHEIYRAILRERIKRGISDEKWIKVYLPILGVLAVAREALNRNQIVGFTNVAPEQVDLVLDKISQFLDELPGRHGNDYRFYHASFGEYLLDETQNTDFPLDGPFYHRLIVSFYRRANERWSDINWTRFKDDYHFHNLAHHLKAAGQIQDLFTLISQPWMDLKYARFGSHSAFSADLDVMIVAARDLSNVVELIRGCLIKATVLSQAADMPPKALGALAWLGQVSRARELAEFISDPESKCTAYRFIGEALLATRGATEALIDLRRALEAAGKIELKWKQEVARAETALTFAKANDSDQAWEIIRALTEGWYKDRALLELAQIFLNTGQYARALESAKEIAEIDFKVRELIYEIASTLTMAKQFDLASEAVELLENDRHKHADAQTNLVLALAQVGYAERAFDLVRSMEEGSPQDNTWEKMALVLAQSGMIEWALRAVGTIREDSYRRQQIMEEIAVGLVHQGEGEKALASVQGNPAIDLRGDVVNAFQEAIVVALAKEGELERSLEILTTIQPLERQMDTSLKLALALVQAKAFEEAFIVVDGIPQAGWHVYTSSRLARELGEAGEDLWAQKVAEQALASTVLFRSSVYRARQMIELAHTLFQINAKKKAIELATDACALALNSKPSLAERLRRSLKMIFAPSRLAESDQVNQRDLARLLGKAMLIFAGAKKSDQAVALISPASSAAVLVEDKKERNYALRDAALALVQLGRIDAALEIANSIDGRRQYAQVLGEAAVALASANEPEQALDLTEEIDHQATKENTLEQMVPILAGANQLTGTVVFNRVMAVTASIKDERTRTQLLKELCLHLVQAGRFTEANQLNKALTVTTAIEDEGTRAQLLKELCPDLVQVGRFAEAIQQLGMVKDYSRPELLLCLTCHSSADGRFADLYQAWQSSGETWIDDVLLAEAVASCLKEWQPTEAATITVSLDGDWKTWSAEAQMIMAVAWVKINEFDLAVEVARSIASDESAENKWELDRVSLALTESGQLAKAFIVVELHKDDWARMNALSDMALTLAKANETDNVITVIEQIKDLDLDQPAQLNQLIGNLAELRSFEPALFATKLLIKPQDSAQTYSDIVWEMAISGDERAKATIDHIQRILDFGRDKEMPLQSINKVAGALTKVGQKDQAIALAHGFLESEKDADIEGRHHEYLAQLAQAWATAGDFETAVSIVGKIDEERSKDIALEHLIVTLIQANRVDRALDLLPEPSSDDNSYYVTPMLTRIAVALACNAQLEPAKDVVRNFKRTCDRSHAFGDIAYALAWENKFAEALVMIEEIEEEWDQNREFEELVTALVGTAKFNHLVTAVTALEDEEKKSARLTTIGVALAKAGAAKQALAIVVGDRSQAAVQREIVNLLVSQQAYDDAIDTARTIADEYIKAYALAGVAEVLIQNEEFERAEKVAQTIADDFHKAETLTKLSKALIQQAKYGEAITAILSLEDKYRKATALRDLVPEFKKRGQIEPVLDAVKALDSWWLKDDILLVLTRELLNSPHYRKAVDAARAINSDFKRSEALWEVAFVLVDYEEFDLTLLDVINQSDLYRTRPAHIEMALALAQAGALEQAYLVIDEIEDHKRYRALSKLALMLTRVKEFAQAFATVERIEKSYQKDNVLVKMATILVDMQAYEQTLVAVEAIASTREQISVGVQITKTLINGGELDRATDLATQLQTTMDDLGDIILSPNTPAEVAQALALTGKTNDALTSLKKARAMAEIINVKTLLLAIAKAWAFIGWQPQTDEAIKQALVAAGLCDDGVPRARAFVEFAQAMIEIGQKARAEEATLMALTEVQSLEDEWQQTEVVQSAALALALASEVDQAVAVLNDSAKNERQRFDLLKALATGLIEAKSFDKALLVVESISDDLVKDNSLRELLDAMVLAGDVEKALAIVDAVEKEEEKDVYLSKVASRLAWLRQYEQALSVANTIVEGSRRRKTLLEIALIMSNSRMFDQALSLAAEIDKEWLNESSALTEISRKIARTNRFEYISLVENLAEDVQGRVLEEIILALVEIWGVERAMAAGELLERLYPKNQVYLWASKRLAKSMDYEASLILAEAIGNEEDRNEALTALGQAMIENKVFYQAQAVADAITSLSQKDALLKEVALALVEIRKFDQATTFLAEVGDELVKADTLDEMISFLLDAGDKVGLSQIIEHALGLAKTFETDRARLKVQRAAISALVHTGNLTSARQIVDTVADQTVKFEALGELAQATFIRSEADMALLILLDTFIAAANVSRNAVYNVLGEGATLIAQKDRGDTLVNVMKTLLRVEERWSVKGKENVAT